MLGVFVYKGTRQGVSCYDPVEKASRASTEGWVAGVQ
jgi:hypothetical protein